jgi:hypothetical protein
MLPFDLKNLSMIDRVVVRHGEEEVPVVAGRTVTIVPHRVIHISLFIGQEQVEYGAPKQVNRARSGEFTTNASGLKSTLMFLQALTGGAFLKGRYDAETSIQEYHRHTLAVVPIRTDQRQDQSA